MHMHLYVCVYIYIPMIVHGNENKGNHLNQGVAYISQGRWLVNFKSDFNWMIVMNWWEEVKCHQDKEKNHFKNEQKWEWSRVGKKVRNSIWSYHIENTNRWRNTNTYKSIYLIFESMGNWKRRWLVSKRMARWKVFWKLYQEELETEENPARRTLRWSEVCVTRAGTRMVTMISHRKEDT